jgi:hypothetical protein
MEMQLQVREVTDDSIFDENGIEWELQQGSHDQTAGVIAKKNGQWVYARIVIEVSNATEIRRYLKK